MRVLLIEDDRRLVSRLRQGLQEEGLAVEAVYDGEEGLAAAMDPANDVVVLDVMLPGLDGVELARQLRAARVPTPILMLTARDAVDDRVLGLEAGADDYLVKPFALKELIARIRALARRHLADRAAVLSGGAVSLDTVARTVRVGDRKVNLTAKEYAVLEYFMLNRGRLLSRDQVMDHVWDESLEGGRNLVEVYVGRLRRKLVDAGAGDPFVTVRHAGYRFEARSR